MFFLRWIRVVDPLSRVSGGPCSAALLEQAERIEEATLMPKGSSMI
jgi:hypothetical protein